ncbi:MAG: transglutaminase family protein [Hydrogenophaga sp.]|jgi:transglutaminase-like putative cysteine protease|nr:transglutaminase family protein [Hydrogenophaga sp.]
MKLRVVHQTRYEYLGEVDLAQHMVHLSPVDTSCQTVLSHSLIVSPEPATQKQQTDAFGNRRTLFALQAPHDRLEVVADSLVDTRTPAELPDSPSWKVMTWERVREQFRYRAQAPYDPASEFLFASPMVPRDPAFAAFARPVVTAGRPLLEAVRALTSHMHHTLRYQTASTEVNTPALQALEQRAGVCQDFAHILIACLRSLGLPARYVSGYLLTRPPPGQPRLIGADASHAWASVYLPWPPDVLAEAGSPPGGAWFDFDPTNDRCGWGSPGEDYVTLAIGRDFSDVSPMRGVIQGSAQHRLEVAVTVAPPDELDGTDVLAAAGPAAAS